MSKFKELLKAHDIHGAQLARKIGCDRSAVSNWVRGKHSPPINKIVLIAQALNVTEQTVIDCFK